MVNAGDIDMSAATVPRPTKIRATAKCAFCSWEAVHTGEDALEVAHFLRARLIDHKREQHPLEGSETVQWLVP